MRIKLLIGLIILLVLVSGCVNQLPINQLSLEPKPEPKPFEGTTCQNDTDCYNKYMVVKLCCQYTILEKAEAYANCAMMCPPSKERITPTMKCINNICNLVY